MSGHKKPRKFITVGVMVGLILTALYFRFFMPPAISAVPSRSMVPTLRVGDLIISKPIVPSKVKVGDIIIVHLPQLLQETYHYPDEVVHRVHEVVRSGDHISFRTKGDNNPKEDPYVVGADNVQGVLVKRIPYAGFVVLFMHSKQGLYFLVSVLVIYLINLLWAAIERREYSLKRSISTLFVGDLKQHIESLEHKHEESYQGIRTALQEFSNAMQEYAHHLQSHTGAVQGMAWSAQELLGAVHTQNQVLAQLQSVLGGGMANDVATPTWQATPLESTTSGRDQAIFPPPKPNTATRRDRQSLYFDYEAEMEYLRDLKRNLGNIGGGFDTGEIMAMYRQQEEARKAVAENTEPVQEEAAPADWPTVDAFPRMTRKERRHLQQKGRKNRKQK